MVNNMRLAINIPPRGEVILVALAKESYGTTEPSEQQVNDTFSRLVNAALEKAELGLAAETTGIQKTLPTLTPSEPITSGFHSTPT
jgi:hypothetical protein